MEGFGPPNRARLAEIASTTAVVSKLDDEASRFRDEPDPVKALRHAHADAWKRLLGDAREKLGLRRQT